MGGRAGFKFRSILFLTALLLVLPYAAFADDISWKPIHAEGPSPQFNNETAKVNAPGDGQTLQLRGGQEEFMTVYRWNNSGIYGSVQGVNVSFQISSTDNCVNAYVRKSLDSIFGDEKGTAPTCTFNDIDTNYFGGGTSGTLVCSIPVNNDMEANFMDVRLEVSDCDAGGPDNILLDYVQTNLTYTPETFSGSPVVIEENPTYFLINNSLENYYINKSTEEILIDNFQSYWGVIKLCWDAVQGGSSYSVCDVQTNWTWEYYGNGRDRAVLLGTGPLDPTRPKEIAAMGVTFDLRNTSNRILMNISVENQGIQTFTNVNFTLSASAIKVNNTADDDSFWRQNVSTLDDWETRFLNTSASNGEWGDANSSLLSQHYLLSDDVTRKKVRFWWEKNFTRNTTLVDTNTTLKLVGGLYPNAVVNVTIPFGTGNPHTRGFTNLYWVDPVVKDLHSMNLTKPNINPMTSDVYRGRTLNLTCPFGGAGEGVNPTVKMTARYCNSENCNPTTDIPTDNSGGLKDLNQNLNTNVPADTIHEIVGVQAGDYRVSCSELDTNNSIRKNSKTVNVTIIEANNWSNFGGDRNRSGFTFGTVPNYQYYDSAGLKDEIVYDSSGGESVEQNPVITADGIFFHATNNFYAYDHRGNLKWSAANPPFTSPYGHPAALDGVVVYGAADSVVARNSTSGNLMWTFSDSGTETTFDEISPLIANGRVWFGNAWCGGSQCYLYAVNLTTGSLIWRFDYPTANTSEGGTSDEPRYIEPGATISDGFVYFSAVHGAPSGSQLRSTIVALNESNGNEMLWGINLSNEFDLTRYNAISVRGNSLYVGVHNLESASTGNLSYLLALNKTNGQQLWRYNFSDVNQFPERVLPVYYGDKIVVSTTDFSNSKIYALNATTGTLIWQYDVTGEDMWSGPSVADSKVVFGTGAGQKVYALSSLNGSLLWTVNAGNSVYSTPALIDDAVYIGVDGGKVLRLRANTTHSNENVQFTAGQVTTVDGVMNSDISVDIHATSSGTGEMHLRKYPMPPNTTNAFGETKLGKYMKITHQNVLNNMDWAVIKLFYTDDDIVALELNESALALLRWNGSAWTCPSTCGVNTVDNYAWINTTSFSTFGMSGGMPSQGGVLEKIDALIDKVKSLDIDGGLKQSLLAKLNAARDAFLRGNIKAAINQLEAFIDEVEAQRGKKIREADADMLISMAKEIIKMLRT